MYKVKRSRAPAGEDRAGGLTKVNIVGMDAVRITPGKVPDSPGKDMSLPGNGIIGKQVQCLCCPRNGKQV
jgi:hypothetical protein